MLGSIFSLQMKRFIIVGAISTIINYCITVFLVLIKISPEYASGGGYIAGFLMGYPLNKHWSFDAKNSERFKQEFIKYFFVYGVSFFINSILAYYSYKYFTSLCFFPNAIVVKVVYYIPVIVITTIINFWGCKYIVFRK